MLNSDDNKISQGPILIELKGPFLLMLAYIGVVNISKSRLTIQPYLLVTKNPTEVGFSVDEGSPPL